jgi:hypothetical protein
MSPEGIAGAVGLAAPFLLYGVLVMQPAERGYTISLWLACMSAAAFILCALAKPMPHQFDLVPFIATVFATMFLSATAGALAYHVVARRAGASWWLRLLLLPLAAAFGRALFYGYQEFLR